MRFELSYALVADTVRQVPLFQGCPESLLRSLVRLLQPIIAVSDEVVVEARSFVDTLYIVHWGRLAVTASSPKAHRAMGIRALEAVGACGACKVVAMCTDLTPFPSRPRLGACGQLRTPWTPGRSSDSSTIRARRQ